MADIYAKPKACSTEDALVGYFEVVATSLNDVGCDGIHFHGANAEATQQY